MRKLLAVLIVALFILGVSNIIFAADMPLEKAQTSVQTATTSGTSTQTQPVNTQSAVAAPVKVLTQKMSTYPAGPIQKLERGFNNAVFGWTEIPKRIVDQTKAWHNPLIGGAQGLFQGSCKAFARTASGISEVLTFPIGRYDKPRVLPDMPAVE